MASATFNGTPPFTSRLLNSDNVAQGRKLVIQPMLPYIPSITKFQNTSKRIDEYPPAFGTSDEYLYKVVAINEKLQVAKIRRFSYNKNAYHYIKQTLSIFGMTPEVQRSIRENIQEDPFSPDIFVKYSPNNLHLAEDAKLLDEADKTRQTRAKSNEDLLGGGRKRNRNRNRNRKTLRNRRKVLKTRKHRRI